MNLSRKAKGSPPVGEIERQVETSCPPGSTANMISGWMRLSVTVTRMRVRRTGAAVAMRLVISTPYAQYFSMWPQRGFVELRPVLGMFELGTFSVRTRKCCCTVQ